MKKQDLSKVTILVVDDDIAVRDSLSEFLSSLGWNVETADNAELGLNLVKQGIADIVISDIQMPGMSGLELLPSRINLLQRNNRKSKPLTAILRY